MQTFTSGGAEFAGRKGKMKNLFRKNCKRGRNSIERLRRW